MRREYFGLGGGLLTDQQLARLIILASSHSDAFEGFLTSRASPDELCDSFGKAARSYGSRNHASQIRIDLDLRKVHAAIFAKRFPLPRIADLRDLLDNLWGQFSQSSTVTFSLSVINAPYALDRQWLAKLFQTEPSAAFTQFLTHPDRDFSWNWPLRIGLPSTTPGELLLKKLKFAKYSHLYEAVNVDGEFDSVDLLLIPDALSSLRELHKPASVAADAVLFLGGAESAAGRVNRQLRSLATRYGASATGLCFVPKNEHLAWTQSLIRELSHNLTLPLAAFNSAKESARVYEGGQEGSGDLPAPLLCGSLHFLNDATIESTATRLANSLLQKSASSIATPYAAYDFSQIEGNRVISPKELGTRILQNIGSLGWRNESGDATSLVRLREELEQKIGPMGLDRVPAAAHFSNASNSPAVTTKPQPKAI